MTSIVAVTRIFADGSSCVAQWQIEDSYADFLYRSFGAPHAETLYTEEHLQQATEIAKNAVGIQQWPT